MMNGDAKEIFVVAQGMTMCINKALSKERCCSECSQSIPLYCRVAAFSSDFFRTPVDFDAPVEVLSGTSSGVAARRVSSLICADSGRRTRKRDKVKLPVKMPL